MARSLALVITLVLLASCASLLGLDGYGPGDGGSVASSSGNGGDAAGGDGGSGGAGASSSQSVGGSGVVVSAADWSAALDAVYSFEQPGNLGYDDSGHDHNLLLGTPPPPLEMQNPPQGAFAISTVGAGAPALSSAEPLFEVDHASVPMTFGAWARTGALGDMNLIARTTAAAGYALAYDQGAKRAECYIDGNGANAGNDSWPADGSWHHVVCRWSPGMALDVFVDGAPAGSNTSVMLAMPGSSLFEISPTAFPFVGSVDEVFFHRARLEDATIARIQACGIDGQRCTCNGASPTEYVACGIPDCQLLPPCNQTAPQ